VKASSLVVILTLLVPGTVESTSYAAPEWTLTFGQTLAETFAQSDAVILGRIENIRTENVPFAGGFVGKRTMTLSVEQVFKGNARRTRIDVAPGDLEGLWSNIELWRDQRAYVVVFLGDAARIEFERKHPDSATKPGRNEWFIQSVPPRDFATIRNPGTERDLVHQLEEMKESQSIEQLTNQSDIVVIGGPVEYGGQCFAFGKSTACLRLPVLRVLKGSVSASELAVTTRGMAVFPHPRTRAIYFLKRVSSSAYAVLEYKAGAKAIRGGFVQDAGLPLEDVVQRIQTVVPPAH